MSFTKDVEFAIIRDSRSIFLDRQAQLGDEMPLGTIIPSLHDLQDSASGFVTSVLLEAVQINLLAEVHPLQNLPGSAMTSVNFTHEI